VTSVNDAPSGADKTVTTNEDTAHTFAASDFGFSDPNDSPANTLAAVKITSLPGAGQLLLNGVAVAAGDLIDATEIAAGHLTFAPAANANGDGYASFTFHVQDDGGTANGGVDLDLTANTITVDVTSVNDAPEGADKTVTTAEDTAYSFGTADFGFSDPNDNPANALQAVKITSLPGAGTLLLNGVAVSAGDLIDATEIAVGHLTFAPAANANGDGYASFTFQVQDDGGTAHGGVDLDQSANTITIDVTAVNDGPVNTVPGAQSVDQNTNLSITGLSVGDIDAGSGTITVALSVLHGSLNISSGVPGGLTSVGISGNGTGSVTLTGTLATIDATLSGTNAVTYKGAAGYSGSDTLTMTSNDGGNTGTGGALSDTDTVAITVNATNQAPVANDDHWYISQGTTAVLPTATAFLANDWDKEGNVLTVTGIRVSGGGSFTGVGTALSTSFGTVTLNVDGTVTYATNNTTSTVTLDYQLSDGSLTSIGHVTITPEAVGNGNTADSINLSGVTDLFAVSYIDAGGGADTIAGGAGSDTLIGSPGTDTIVGSGGSDFLIGSSNADTINGGAGDDVIQGGPSSDTLDGGSGVDLLDYSYVNGGINATLGAGGSGTTTADGAGNPDSYSNFEGVIGGSGGDILTGNAGDNIFRGGPGNDVIDGGAGNDLLDFSDGTSGITMTLVQSSSNTAVNLAAAGLGTDTYRNMEGVIGTRFADLLTGSSGNDVLRGGTGDDTLTGGGGSDTIQGGQGADTITISGGHNQITYAGNDLAGGGVDKVNGFTTGAGHDSLSIKDLLIGYGGPGGSNDTDFVHLTDVGTNTTVSIDRDGVGTQFGFQDVAVLNSVTGSDLSTLLADGNIVTH
jgi:hypothetical protein